MNTLKLHVQNNGKDRSSRTAPRPFFSFKAQANGTHEIAIYEQIGADYWSGEGVGAKDFADALKTVPKGTEIVVRINSPGGNVHDGMAIHSLLAERRANVVVKVDGVAASIASVIALAGRTLEMPANALLMIHDPSGYAGGTADDFRKYAEALDKHRDAILAVYANKTGKTSEVLKQLMKEETWMTGQDAKDEGFADTVTEQISLQARFDFSGCTRVPAVLNTTATGGDNDKRKNHDMNRQKIIAALRKRGVEFANDITDEALMELLEATLAAEPAESTPAPRIVKSKNGKKAAPKAGSPGASSAEDPEAGSETETDPASGEDAASSNAAVATLRTDLNRVTAHLETERKNRIGAVIDRCIAEDRVPANQKDKWLKRAIADETVLDDLQAMEQRPPGVTAAGIVIVGDSPRDIEKGLVNLRAPLKSWLRGNSIDAKEISANAKRIAVELSHTGNRAKLQGILNANTIDTDLKRNVILADQMRAFKRRITMLNVFATQFTNVPLEGTNKILIPFYELDTVTSKNFVPADGYVFDNDTSVGTREVTVNKRKYKPMDFSSETFRRQPYFNPSMSLMMKAEQLGLDVWLDILSVITASNYGTSILSVEPGVFDTDDVIQIRKACQNADWPEIGRALVLGTDHEAALLQDNTLKFYQNSGDTAPLRQGSTGRLLNFDMYYSPRIPSNSEDLGGFTCLPQAAMIATAPIAPAPGVRSQLLSYDLVIDPETGLAFEYRYWGEAFSDKDHEVIEINYGYNKGNASALKRITNGAATNSSSSSQSSVNSSSSSSS